MRLAEEIQELVRAGFSGIWVRSCEQDDAIAELAQLCRDEDWRMNTWDIDVGLRGAPTDQMESPGVSVTDPLGAVRHLESLPSNGQPSLLVLSNLHRFLGSAEVVQAIFHQVSQGKAHQRFLVVLAPVVQLPVELERVFTVVEHELPSREQLAEIATDIATEGDEFPSGKERERILDAACGLSRYEAENAFALSLVRHGRLEPSAIWQLKSQTLIKSGLLSLHRGGESFAELGGLESLKQFCCQALRSQESRSVQAKGVLLLGVPGTGKSAFAKALGREIGRPTLTLDVGALMGGIVGQTEERTRRALKIIDAMQPAVLFIDELEKALGGTSNSGQTDSGVGSRMLGTLLTWLADHDSDVFVIATSNDVSKLPPELTRAERFDAIFFLDLPGKSQKEAIWQMYLERFSLDPSQGLPNDGSWTGAEIRACCRLAALLNVPLVQAAQNVVPVAVTSAESVERLRSWASGRCLSAESGGVFNTTTQATRKPRRRLTQNPESNQSESNPSSCEVFMTATTLEQPTDRSSPSGRLRSTMCATRVNFTWLGTQKTLTRAQRAQAALSFNAQGEFLSAGKKLLDTKNPRFKAVTSERNRIRSFWTSISLPYPEPAVRLIRQDRVDTFQDWMSEHRQDLIKAVEELDEDYFSLKEAARQRLGRLYNEADYPMSLIGLFDVTWDFPNVEAPSYLRQLDPQLYQDECRRVQARFDEAVQLAESAFVEELSGLVTHLTERLSGQQDGRAKVFRDSAIGNLNAFFERFRSLNVRSNDQLDALVSQCQDIVQGVQPQTLRDDAQVRQTVSRELSSVQATLDELLVDRPRRRIIRSPK